MHIVDLDGALRGTGANDEALKKIVENVNKDHITWQGTNPNGEVESFTIEYCKKCGEHFEDTCGYTIEELKTGTVTKHRCGKFAVYFAILVLFIFTFM